MTIKLKSIDFIDELMGKTIESDDEAYILSEVRRLIIEDWLALDAIPRAKVQKSVDAIVKALDPCSCGKETCETCDLHQKHGVLIRDILDVVFSNLRNHTGVKPDEPVETLAKNYDSLWSVTDIAIDLETRDYPHTLALLLSRAVYLYIHGNEVK